MSSYALNIGPEGGSDGDDSISDISLDSCFRFDSSERSRNNHRDSQDENDDDDVVQDKNNNHTGGSVDNDDYDFDTHDGSDLDDTAEKRRVSYRNSDPDFGTNMMVVTSFRKSKHRDPSYRQPSFTMEDIDVNNNTAFLTFESSDFRLVPRGSATPKRMSRVEERIQDESAEDAPQRTSKSKSPVNNKALARGGGSRMLKMTRTLSKAKEFEDIIGTTTDRNILHDVDPFLSGDDEDDTQLYNPDRVVTKRRNKTLRRKKRDVDWDAIDNKAKASLKAYDGHEGNLFPELSQRDAAKFRNSGNAWLEGRYATTADWKRNATGMTLELPPIKIKPQTVTMSQFELKQLVSESVPLSSGKTKARIELSLGPTKEEATALQEEAQLPAVPTKPDSIAPLPTTSTDGIKQVDRRGLFFRNNSMPSFKLNLKRPFKRSSTTSSNCDDADPLLAATSMDDESYTLNLSQGQLVSNESVCSSNNSRNLSMSQNDSTTKSIHDSTIKTKRTRRRSSFDVHSDDGTSSIPELSPLVLVAASATAAASTESTTNTTRSKKDRSSKEGRYKLKSRDRHNSFESSDGNNSLLDEGSLHKKDVDTGELFDFYQPISDVKGSTATHEAESLTPPLRQRRLSSSIHHRESSSKRSEDQSLHDNSMDESNFSAGNKSRKDWMTTRSKNMESGDSNDDANPSDERRARKHKRKSLRKRDKSCDPDDIHDELLEETNRKYTESSPRRIRSDREVFEDSSHPDSKICTTLENRRLGDDSVQRSHKSSSRTNKSGLLSSNPSPGTPNMEDDYECSIKPHSKSSKDHRRRSSSKKVERDSRQHGSRKDTPDDDNELDTSTMSSSMREKQRRSRSKDSVPDCEDNGRHRRVSQERKGSSFSEDMSDHHPAVHERSTEDGKRTVKRHGSSVGERRRGTSVENRSSSGNRRGSDSTEPQSHGTGRNGRNIDGLELSLPQGGGNDIYRPDKALPSALQIELTKRANKRLSFHEESKTLPYGLQKEIKQIEMRRHSLGDGKKPLSALQADIKTVQEKFRRKRRSSSVPRSQLDQHRNSEGSDDRSARIPRDVEEMLHHSPDHGEKTHKERSASRPSTSQRRRSTSLPRGSDVTYSPMLDESIQQGNESKGSRTVKKSTLDQTDSLAKKQSDSRYTSSHKRRSSSLPRRAEQALRRSIDEAVLQGRESNDYRQHKFTTELHLLSSTSAPRRQRSTSGSTPTRSGVPREANDDSNKSRGSEVSYPTRSPVRRRSIGGTLYDAPENDIARPRRRRSINLGGDVISSRGVDEPPPTPVRKKNESHQYVQFTGDARGVQQSAAMVPSAASKPSFLSRIATRFEAETVKAFEKRNIVPRVHIERDPAKGPERESAKGSERRSVMQRTQSERNFYNLPLPVSKYTPTVMDKPERTNEITYSDLVMQGKLGIAPTSNESQVTVKGP